MVFAFQPQIQPQEYLNLYIPEIKIWIYPEK